MSRRRSQLALPLRERPELRHASRETFRRLPAHVTLRVRPGLRSLRSVPIVEEIARFFRAGRARPGFRLVHYSMQSNHAHLVVEAVDREALGRGMMALGARLARAVNRVARLNGAVLADRYHVRILRTARECHHALRYVLLNARRHAAKLGHVLGASLHLDRASSARWFDGWKPSSRVTERARDARPVMAPVARPRTWPLTVGWRRYGLLDPSDVPGS